jgi:hypothetical protein
MNDREFEIFKMLYAIHIEGELIADDIEHVGSIACEVVKYANRGALKYHSAKIDAA